MSMKLNMLPPSVNNMSVRVFVRAAGLPFEEENVWGQTQSEEYLSKFPAGLTPSVETEELPQGGLWESCAVMMYLASREGLDDFYPTDLERRAMVDAANFYTMSILYPLVARATYPRLSFAGYPGEVSTSEAANDEEKEVARKAAEDAIPPILETYRRFYGADDVVEAVRFGREHDILVSVRGGGHAVAGHAVCDDGLMIDLALMKAARVDREKRVVRAAGGLLWREL